MTNTFSAFPEPLRPRRSACAEASRSAQLQRVRAMTVTQRIEVALSIKDRFRHLKPVPFGQRMRPVTL